jgi:hypothetical protein
LARRAPIFLWKAYCSGLREEGDAMGILSVLGEVIRDLLIFVGAMAVLLVVLVVVISRLHAENPVKRMLTLLSYRVGATLAAGVVALPVEPIPGVDVAYDIGIPLLLILYWLSFFRNASHIMSNASSGKRPPGR